LGKIAILENVDSAHWNHRVKSLNGPMQLTAEWAAFVCAKDNMRPLFLEGDHDSGSFAAIVYLSSSRKWPLSRWPTASADCIPLARDRAGAVRELELILRGRGVSAFQLNSFAYDGSSPTHLAPLDYEETARFEFVLSLDQGIDPVWNGMRPTLRSDIRRFERSGVLCRARSDREVVAALHSIELETAARHRAQGKQGNPMREATYEALWDTLITTGRARVYLAENEGVPIASVVIGVCGQNAYYLYGGATLSGLALNAPKGLLWFAIQQEYENGVRAFNLGGMSASAAQPDSLDHGLYKFKTGFGATQRSCISGRKVLKPVLVSMQARLRRVLQSVRNQSTPLG
jgi:hypothetical protein